MKEQKKTDRAILLGTVIALIFIFFAVVLSIFIKVVLPRMFHHVR